MSEEGAYELTFTSGVFIHTNPEHLNTVYDNLVRLSRKYVMTASSTDAMRTYVVNIVQRFRGV